MDNDIEIVIKIPKENKKYIDEAVKEGIAPPYFVVENLWNATANGTVLPDNATNGDMIKALFHM